MPSAAALRVEEILEKALAARPGSRLLTGLGARVSVASALPARAEPAEPLPALDPLDRLLAGGLPKGKLTELVGRKSSGRFSIALAAVASATSRGEAAALVDLDGHLDPQAAATAGADLERLLWVRPRRAKEALAACEILLSTGFALVACDLGLFPRGARYLPDAVWVRLSRAAEARGAALLLLTPWRVCGIAAEVVIAADGPRPLWHDSGRSLPLLAGISSRLTLQKLARLTPGSSQSLRLSVAEFPASFSIHNSQFSTSS